MFFLATFPGLVLFLGMLKMPESPRWLIRRARHHEALSILTRIRGHRGHAQNEVSQIRNLSENNSDQGRWRDLGRPWVRPALVAALGVSILCQLTGINAVIYYAPTILVESGFGSSASLLAIIGVGVTLLVMTVIGTYLVDHIGRRRLMLVFIPLSVIALLVLGAAFWGGHPTGVAQWAVVISMLAYIAFNGGSLSVVIWLLNSEVIPLSVRGKGTGLASVSMWVSDLIVSLTTLSLIQSMGASGTFWLYGIVSIGAFAFVYFCVPETKGRSLEEIEKSLRDGTFSPLSRMMEHHKT